MNAEAQTGHRVLHLRSHSTHSPTTGLDALKRDTAGSQKVTTPKMIMVQKSWIRYEVVWLHEGQINTTRQSHTPKQTSAQLREDAEGGDPTLLHSVHLEAPEAVVVHECERIDGVEGDLVEGAEAVQQHGEDHVPVAEERAVAGVLVEEEDELLAGVEAGFAAAQEQLAELVLGVSGKGVAHVHLPLGVLRLVDLLLRERLLGTEQVHDEEKDVEETARDQRNQVRRLDLTTETKSNASKEGERIRDGLHHNGVRQISSENGADEATHNDQRIRLPSNGAAHKDHSRSDGDVTVVAQIGNDRLRNTEVPVRQAVEEPDHETEVVVLGDAQENDEEKVADRGKNSALSATQIVGAPPPDERPGNLTQEEERNHVARIETDVLRLQLGVTKSKETHVRKVRAD